MRSWLVVALGLAGCASRQLNPDTDMLEAPADLGVYCGGNFAKMVANGLMSTPVTVGRADILNCCDAAEIDIQSDGFGEHMVFWWRAQGGVANLPATLDLANLPSGWSAALMSGPLCDTFLNCPPPNTIYNTLAGSLTVARSSTGYTMSLCLDLPESPSTPLHTLQLWAPNVNGS